MEENLNRIIKSKKISHAYIIQTNDYVYALKQIKEFVIEIFNIDNNIKNIREKIETNNFSDFEIIETENNLFKKNQILDLQKKFTNKSIISSKRIYLRLSRYK